MTRTGAIGVAALTVAALAVRLAGLDQSLYGDEVFTYDIVTHGGLVDVLRNVAHTSITPPLHYVVAWAAAHVGDPRLSIRVPSAVAGALTVPAVWALGRRTVGRGAALVAAALTALSPFLIFYGQEARAYATLVLLVTLSTYGLVRAVAADGRRRDWALFAVAACAALYTHYTAVFPLVAQGAWALWRAPERRAAVIGSHVVVAIGYLPWVPAYLLQRRNPGIEAIGFFYPLSLHGIADDSLRLLSGYGGIPLDVLPGHLPLAFLAAGLLCALVGGALRLHRDRPARWTGGVLLVLALALAAPVGELLYALFGSTILAPRNLLSSFPGMALLLGVMVTSSPRPLLVAALAGVSVGVGTGLVKSLQTESRRPPMREAAAWIDAHAPPGEPAFVPVLLGSTAPGDRAPAARALSVNLRRARPVRQVLYPDAARAASGYRRVIFVCPSVPGSTVAPPPRMGSGWRLVVRRSWPSRFGLVALYAYVRA